jgi:hypothetical protein
MAILNILTIIVLFIEVWKILSNNII